MVIAKQNIAILMATYNGERYLRQQIDSIMNQNCTNWHLYIHDDGSTDNTLSILSEYANMYPEKVTLLEYPSQGGACNNFMSLLNEVEADYYMFSDQDDVWLPEKIETEFSVMQSLEKEHAGKPLLVATDLKVVDENMNELQPSLWEIEGICPEYINTFDEIAANTVVSGCTMLFNHTLKEVSLPLSPKATMHDAWLACCTLKYGGAMKCLPTPLLLYRQHNGNVIGAKDVRSLTVSDRIKGLSLSYQLNKKHYQMLGALSYGGVMKYIYYKWLYLCRRRCKKHC